jgi:hypothetical protein
MDIEDIRAEFATIQKRWLDALTGHRMAPPDAGFGQRLATLAGVLHDEALICQRAAAYGLAWSPRRTDAGPPYELRPNTGRRGPASLWQRFDNALAELNSAAAGTDLTTVGDAFRQLAEITTELAVAVEKEDHAAGAGNAVPGRRSA